MMNIRKWTYLNMVSLLTLLLTACDADSGEDLSQERTLHLVAVTQTQSDIDIQTTRSIDISDPNDATVKVSYDNYTSRASIRTYIATSNRLDFYGDFEYDGSSWTTKIPLDNDNYFIYGFMPSTSLRNSTTIEPRNSSFANGAILTIGNAPALMTEPLCAIVGVKRASDGSTPISSATGMTRGSYSYPVTRNDNDNYIYMLLDQLYTCIRFTMSVDAEYYTLRRIHLKEFKITPKAGLVNVRVTLTAGSFNTLTTTYNKAADYSGTGVPLWEGTKDLDLEVNNTITPNPTILYGEEFTNFYIAPAEGNTEFTIHCKYDVYDRKDNLIRKDCEASNKLTLGGTGWKPGERYTIPLVVMPTYLYVLSEPDLDNPTIKVE